VTQREALTLTARLFGFFPAGNTQKATVELYASKLMRYPVAAGAKAIDSLIEHRTDRFAPTWAEILDEIREHTLRPVEIERPDDGVPPPPDFIALREQLRIRQAARSDVLVRKPSVALGAPVKVGDYVKIVDRSGRILWDYTLTGDVAQDAAELRWGAEQCGLTNFDMANVMPRIAKP
jgi:hypothetical protein